jgi:hypothetical protein
LAARSSGENESSLAGDERRAGAATDLALAAVA